MKAAADMEFGKMAASGSCFSSSGSLLSYMGFSAGSIFFFGIIRHIYHYRKLKMAAQQLRIEKQAAELNYLKSQTNPHFLFNTFLFIRGLL